jgi:general secretion pathway protein A
MYLSHYNLQKKPFSISPDPRFLWFSDSHKEALAVLKYGILENKGFLLLTGDIGTGKTALINALVKIIDVAALVATVPDPGLNSLDFFNFLSEEFGMNRTFETKGEFLIHFKQFLHEAYRGQKKVLLIIDEAQRLDHEMLEQIRLLSNIEMDSRKLINIFFVGQSEFKDTLLKERNKAVRQRISESYHLDPLAENETAEYIHHRLEIAGAGKEIFSAGAIREIFSFSKGNPRLINIICDHALLTGYSSGVTSIDKKSVAECAQELQITGDIFKLIEQVSQKENNTTNAAEIGRSQKQKVVMSLAVMVLLTIAGYFMYDFQVKEPQRWELEDIAAKKDIRFSDEEKKALVATMPEENRADKDKPVAEIHAKKTNVAQNDESSGRKTTTAKDTETSAGGNEAVRGFARHSIDIAQNPNQKVIVHFEHNSNELPDQAFESLNRVVQYASTNPESEIIINGYTDSYGNYWYNKKLSKFRADIVKSYFAGQGIALARIKTLGRGSENPMAGNDTSEGRKQNRRVEIKIKMKE